MLVEDRKMTWKKPEMPPKERNEGKEETCVYRYEQSALYFFPGGKKNEALILGCELNRDGEY